MDNGSGGVTVTGAIVLWTLSIALYLLPTIVAIFRDHPNALGIFILNLFLGWTFVFWVAALVWSVLSIRPSPSIVAGEIRARVVPVYPDDGSPFGQSPKQSPGDRQIPCCDPVSDVAAADWVRQPPRRSDDT
jgi:hypothetical protein